MSLLGFCNYVITNKPNNNSLITNLGKYKNIFIFIIITYEQL